MASKTARYFGGGHTAAELRQRDTFQDEYYILRDEVWLSANPKREGMLCIGCVETRIGRRLTPEDFTDVPINRDDKGWQKSKRLLSRLGRT
jgi:hypothetical protein